MPGIELFDSEHIASFLTLTFLEIVLAGDNLVLIAILAGKLPPGQRPAARRFGLLAAVITRLMLLFSLFWISHLHTEIPLNIPGIPLHSITPRTIVFGLGGAFLIWKALSEILAILWTNETTVDPNRVRPWHSAFLFVILQIALFDVVFSLDSVIAAIGIARHLEVMVAAILTATAIMFFLVNPISNFIDRYPVVKLIALNFLVLVGALLVAEAFGVEVQRAAFYVALAIAIVVQVIYWALPSWGRAGLLIIFAALAIAIVAPRFINVEPIIGPEATATLRDFTESGWAALNRAVEWLQGMLAMV